MQFFNKLVATFLLAFFVTASVPWQVSAAQKTKSGVVNARDKILGPTTNQQQKIQQQNNQTSPPAGKGNPGPLPCKSKNNPKCDPVSPSKPGDNPGKGKGKGN